MNWLWYMTTAQAVFICLTLVAMIFEPKAEGVDWLPFIFLASLLFPLARVLGLI